MEDERKSIKKMLNSNHFRRLIDNQTDHLEKNSEQSEILRKAGNDLYKMPRHNSHIHTGIWNFYAGSISRAESNTEDLAMGFGNRSAILLHLSKYEASIRDIDRALSITKNVSLKIKLLLRKAKCLHMIGSKQDQSTLKEVDFLLDKINNESFTKSAQAELDKVKIILKKPATQYASKNKNTIPMDNLNKKYKINDFSSVELQFDETNGRHLVAAKDITPGEVIYIEKPYIQFVNTGRKYANCAHCIATVWDNIPCDHCASAMYCSEKCKKEAWDQYHHIDCSVYAAFQMDSNDSYRQLALRILCQALKEHGSVENLKAEVSSFDNCTDYKEGFIHDGKLGAIGLKSIYLLCKNVPTSGLKDHVKKTASALRSLGRHTSLFGKNFDFMNLESYKNNDNVVFLGSLFLRLSKISQLNAFQMWNRTYTCKLGFDERTCSGMECCTAGAFIAPITGLLNHDCFPNAGRCYTNEHSVLLYAIKPIRKGSQIFTSYLEAFRDDSLSSRRKLLSDRYNFKCHCFSCEKKWETDFKQNHDLKTIAGRTNWENYKKTIDRLTKDLEKAFASSGSEKLPSNASAALAGCLQVVFDKLYGIQLDVPANCNNI